MTKFLVVVAVLGLVISSAFGGALIFEGPDQRGEGPLPPGPGRFKINVYAEGILGVAACSTTFSFFGPEGNECNDLFLISKDEGNPDYADFGYQMIDLGSSVPAGIFPVYTAERNTAGFMLLTGEKDFIEKTLLYSTTWDYTATAEGTYTIKDSPDSVIGDATANPIFYDVIPGSFTIPEPVTMALLGLGTLGLLRWKQKKAL